MIDSGFEAVIGLEVHCQLATESKLFCSCKVKLEEGVSVADVSPNQNTCPICTAQPGTLPVINEKAVQLAIKAGVATNCKINTESIFARKNYFYPDLPKGYQISQYDQPLCQGGYVEIELENQPNKKVRLNRIHMEEDAGKNVHLPECSIVNLNRAGVPLVEIVTEPDLSSSQEAGEYLRNLHSLMTFIGVTEGNMQEGQFRCDANISVRPKGATELGTRAEIKNVNSFKFVEKAIDYEIMRQIEVIQSGEQVVQETRLYDSQKNVTESMRSKEEAHDYRYFADPDLVPLQVESAFVNESKESLPELPSQKKQRYQKEYGVSLGDAKVLAYTLSYSVFFESVMSALGNENQSKLGKTAAHLIVGEGMRLVKDTDKDIRESFLSPNQVAEIVNLISDSSISNNSAKKLIQECWTQEQDVSALVESLGLKQVSDMSVFEPVADELITAFPKQVQEFRDGKEKVIGFFVGQMMKKTGGKANPGKLKELLEKRLKEEK